MRELSLNILDIAHNSIRAKACNLSVDVYADTIKGSLKIEIRDDGCGMNNELLARVLDPFSTTRTTRKVGMGLPLFKAAAESAGGYLSIISEEGKGTSVTAIFELNHLDRMPLGDLADTTAAIIMAAPEINLKTRYRVNDREYLFNSEDIRKMMDNVPLIDPEVIEYIKDFLKQEFEVVNGGLII